MYPSKDLVFLNKEEEDHQDFFFMYDFINQDLHIRILFNDFTIGVLQILNVALS